MFTRILIANRGEIACRIARTCRQLGIECVAVHSRADANALHVRVADRAEALHGEGIADGYLDGAQIIKAAQRAGAQAIHPGYGFLAENADFAAACEAAGIRFIGPQAEAIRAMGDKAEARRLARAVGVPVVPGIEEDITDERDRDARLLVAAATLQYPLMVKACAGGGGRGMRRVAHADELAAAIDIARREALAGFGSDALIIERYIEQPRHVEVQILGDSRGTILHLHERDCSIQRRHQKLIEEAPAPGLRQDTRDALHQAALSLANAIGYENAGTVEFVLDPRDQSFYFLEINTRLQVEHPVTEAILGIDLVEWQIRIASGEALSFAQSDLQPTGWAMEARLNAEDPVQDFRPATGTVQHFGPLAHLHAAHDSAPPDSAGIRLDAGIDTGSRVEPWYDSMLGKLIVHGRDRDDAAAQLARALTSMSLMGVRSNIAFLADVVRQPAFRQGRVNTDFIPEHYPDGWQPRASSRDLAMAAALLLGPRAALMADNDDTSQRGPWHTLPGFRLLANAGHRGRWQMLLEDENATPFAVWVHIADGALRLQVGVPGALPPADAGAHSARARLQSDCLEFTLDERDMRLCVLRQDDTVHLYGDAGWHAFRRLDAIDALAHAEDGAGTLNGPLRAPVPGVIASVEVNVGDNLVAAAPVLVIESMKMYQTLTTPVAARVVAVHCSAGDAVTMGQALITLEAITADDPVE